MAMPETSTLEAQNQLYVEYATNGGQLPAYTWHPAPNVPPPPMSHEQRYALGVESQIEDAVSRIRHQIFKAGKSEILTDEIRGEYATAQRMIQIAMEYSQDITRCPAFYIIAAFNRLQEAKPFTQPKPTPAAQAAEEIIK